MDFAWVEGAIADAQGEAVSRAVLTISILEEGCSGTPLTTGGGPFIIGLDGMYRVLMSIPASDPESFVGCVEVLVQPFTSTGLGPAAAHLDGVTFGRTPNSAPTVEIDVLVQ